MNLLVFCFLVCVRDSITSSIQNLIFDYFLRLVFGFDSNDR